MFDGFVWATANHDVDDDDGDDDEADFDCDYGALLKRPRRRVKNQTPCYIYWALTNSACSPVRCDEK